MSCLTPCLLAGGNVHCLCYFALSNILTCTKKHGLASASRRYFGRQNNTQPPLERNPKRPPLYLSFYLHIVAFIRHFIIFKILKPSVHFNRALNSNSWIYSTSSLPLLIMCDSEVQTDFSFAKSGLLEIIKIHDITVGDGSSSWQKLCGREKEFHIDDSQQYSTFFWKGVCKRFLLSFLLCRLLIKVKIHCCHGFICIDCHKK